MTASPSRTAREITCEDVKYGVSRTFATDVISEGPTYQIQYLDIPTVKGFTKGAAGAAAKPGSASAYGGPYSDNLTLYSDEATTKPIPNDKAAYDKAVTCDGKTITFSLSTPHADFNYTTTLGFSPVPKAADTGENYGTATPPVSVEGPYKVENYTTGNGGKMILVRNPNWKRRAIRIRPAYPDRWEVHFGVDPKVIDQRLIRRSGDDAVRHPVRAHPAREPRRRVLDTRPRPRRVRGPRGQRPRPVPRYYWINVKKVKNVKIRQAMAVALDRECNPQECRRRLLRSATPTA